MLTKEQNECPDITIACAEDTDPDLTHDDCDGTWRGHDWDNWPVRQINGICSCPCHKEGGTQ